jgi:F0F1-type ATP synthase membrane subunit c/vacuolar-type H+-ATPase subunit K
MLCHAHFSFSSSGFMHLACGLSVGLTGLAAGYAIGIVGESVRGLFSFS